jgi:uncharacterized protein YigE (DUF2233 family)
MPRQTILCYICGFLLLLCTASACADWHELSPGIEYSDLNANILVPWSHVHVFRIDLKKNKLDLITANELSLHNASADMFAEHSNALIALNGGFFDQNYHPLGLRIGNQRQHSPLKRISWWGIFYIKNQKPGISSLKQYNSNNQVDFAVQSGPRLLIKGKVPSLKPGYAERSALGITSDGKVIVLVTNNAPMTTTTLAQLFKASPLNCTDALNLDGGNSSQLSAHMGLFQINVHGFSNVSDAIVVKHR